MLTSSPHLTQAGSTAHIMRLVILATIPALAVMTWFFGWGNLINILWASIVALACEAILLKIRNRPLAQLADSSALLTAVLIGLALPSTAPWWLTLIATSFAIVIAKQLYGGLGQNPFNPAMVGYALALIAFPVEMTSWMAPRTLLEEGQSVPTLMQSFASIFGFIGLGADQIADAVTMATPLDSFKHKGDLIAADVWRMEPTLTARGWIAWQLISAGYLIGGVYLVYRRVFTWHAPLSMLLSLAIISLIFWLIDPNEYASPQLHLLGGATMLGAFFIVTDPVTSSTSLKGKVVFGCGVGILIYLIRTWGSYPDGVAFSVLLMNFAAPLIDHFFQPRTYGH